MDRADAVDGPLTGLVFNIQRHSTEDGPGIRTTVFLKGCPMRCPWCHNPEGRLGRPDLVWHKVRCVGARECLSACPKNALALTPDGMAIDKRACDLCGLCVEACPATALETIGKRRTVPDVVDVALRDRVFYDTSGGGVTLSGGEPALQPEFSRAVMAEMRGQGVHVALDTCGGVSWRRLAPLVALADLVLYDLKIMDEADHRRHTGISLDLVLQNARRIADAGKPMWVRTPVIPGYTDGDDNIRRIARFIGENLPTVERYDILAFNNTCVGKYERLGWAFPLAEEGLLSEERMTRLVEIAAGEGLSCVRWSGMTRRTVEAQP